MKHVITFSKVHLSLDFYPIFINFYRNLQIYKIHFNFKNIRKSLRKFLTILSKRDFEKNIKKKVLDKKMRDRSGAKRSRDHSGGDDISPSERRGWRVIHQSLVITQINLKSRSLMAFVDLRVKPLDRNLKGKKCGN